MSRPVRLVRTLPYAPEVVWEALVDPERLSEWLGENDFAPRVGHAFELRTPPRAGWDGVMRCKVLALDPPRRLVFSSESDAVTRGGTSARRGSVAISLTPVPEGTRLVLEHEGLDDRGRAILAVLLPPAWLAFARSGWRAPVAAGKTLLGVGVVATAAVALFGAGGPSGGGGGSASRDPVQRGEADRASRGGGSSADADLAEHPLTAPPRRSREDRAVLSSFRALLAQALLVVTAACGPTPAAAPPVPSAPPAPPPDAAARRAPAQRFDEAPAAYEFADPDRRKKLEAAFPAIDALAEGELRDKGLPSIVVGVVVDGELVHTKGIGVTSLDGATAPDADTIYRIGSMTKSFTGLAVLALRDQGVLSLDDPLTRWVPEAAGLVYPSRDAPPITLRHLLTHTSGLPLWMAFDFCFEDPAPTEAMLVGSLAGYPLLHAPGMRYRYSNLGFALLSLVVARASGVPLRDFVAARILKPLGMTSTAYDPADLNVAPARVATGYQKRWPGAPTPTTRWRLGATEGMGGLYASLRDVARYLAFNMAAYPPRDAPDDGPVRRSSLREAHLGGFRAWRPTVTMRVAPGTGESLVTAESATYGYGWVWEDTCDFDDLVWHNGAVDGFHSSMAFLKDRGVGVVTLTNGQFTNQIALARKLLDALRKTGGLVPRTQDPVLPPAFAPALARFLAVYDTWSDAGYEAMMTSPRLPTPHDVARSELAALRSLHGACTTYKPLAVLAPRVAKVALACEHGTFELIATLVGDQLLELEPTSRDVPAPPPLAHAAERLAGLVGKWDDKVYAALFAGRPPEHRTAEAASFADLRAAHASCSVKAYERTRMQQVFKLRCERGGGLRLSVDLDPKDEARVAKRAFEPDEDGACPVK